MTVSGSDDQLILFPSVPRVFFDKRVTRHLSFRFRKSLGIDSPADAFLFR